MLRVLAEEEEMENSFRIIEVYGENFCKLGLSGETRVVSERCLVLCNKWQSQ